MRNAATRKKVEKHSYSLSKKEISYSLPLELLKSNANPISLVRNSDVSTWHNSIQNNDIDKIIQEGNYYFCGRLEGNEDVYMVFWYPQGRFMLTRLSLEFSPSHK